jgi:hypothetical protein
LGTSGQTADFIRLTHSDLFRGIKVGAELLRFFRRQPATLNQRGTKNQRGTNGVRVWGR